MKTFIQHNPFRILGIASNADANETVRNCNMIKAMSLVGRNVSFKTDLTNLFQDGEVKRSKEDVMLAQSEISYPMNHLKYGMFWFMNGTDADEEAISLMADNQMSAARAKLTKIREMSAGQNLMMTYLVGSRPNYKKAIMLAIKLFDLFGDEYVKTLSLGCNLIPKDELLPMYLDLLYNEVSDKDELCKVADEINNESFVKAWAKVVANATNKYLQKEYNISQTAECIKADDHYRIAVNLKEHTEDALTRLRNYAKKDESVASIYNTIADKISEEVLNHSIEYYNGSTYGRTIKSCCASLERFSYQFAVSPYLRLRVQKNLNILLGRNKDAPLFPNGKADDRSDRDRTVCNSIIAGILSVLTEAKTEE